MKRALPLLLLCLALCACSRTSSGTDDGDDGTMGHAMMHGDPAERFLPSAEDLMDLPEAGKSEVIEVKDGDTVELEATMVRNTLGGQPFAMYAYNGQFPGPTLKAEQGARFRVKFKNRMDLPTSVHWHGLRLDNASDGVPGITQDAVEPGDSFTYEIALPDEGSFWYHPHVREDIQQDLGLYGAIVVTPKAADRYAPATAEETLLIDDIALDGQGIPKPYGKDAAADALMGRYGDTFLVNGGTGYTLRIPQGGVARFRLLNAAGTRTIRFSVPGAQMKLVGGDAGRMEHEVLTDAVTLGPSDRATVDVLFPASGEFQLLHASPERTAVLGTVTVTTDKAPASTKAAFTALRTNDDVVRDIDGFRPFFGIPPAETLRMMVEMSGMAGMGGGHAGHGGHGSGDGIEWEDSMAPMNAASTSENTVWKLVDEATGKENMDISYVFERGRPVRISLVNDASSMHPMQHPVHFHGQRFLVLSTDGVPNKNLSWEDTVLVPSGATTEILLDASNPGDWMIHCHIAEHLTAGMMARFTVK